MSVDILFVCAERCTCLPKILRFSQNNSVLFSSLKTAAIDDCRKATVLNLSHPVPSEFNYLHNLIVGSAYCYSDY